MSASWSMSPPARGAWIATHRRGSPREASVGCPPRGGRGSQQVSGPQPALPEDVAPREGGVDRNY